MASNKIIQNRYIFICVIACDLFVGKSLVAAGLPTEPRVLG
jgi:hypothetical protein